MDVRIGVSVIWRWMTMVQFDRRSFGLLVICGHPQVEICECLSSGHRPRTFLCNSSVSKYSGIDSIAGTRPLTSIYTSLPAWMEGNHNLQWIVNYNPKTSLAQLNQIQILPPTDSFKFSQSSFIPREPMGETVYASKCLNVLLDTSAWMF